MGFFVPQELEENKSQSKNEPISDRLDLILLSNAKHMGLSFQELNEFRVRDYLEFTDIYIGKKKKVRKATQEDIDRFFA